MRDFTSRHACLEVKFGFRKVQACFIGGSLPVTLSSMGGSSKVALVRALHCDIAIAWFVIVTGKMIYFTVSFATGN